ncbi:CWH43 [[Candida] subhashii]|uniref:CWH43 n=1 Tax=[Candida] subhashii TaxID=561895 RepID=A0A8J5QKP0_9ASCO|nr:CWH43 [[Candida] subhashii]KAG7662213.1 CWH43 [[Candida] subhashii]
MSDKEQLNPVSIDTEKTEVFRFNVSIISYLHSIFALSSFLAALAVGSYLHYYKIVQNASYGYPDEWFPSVSATIGDRYPERSVFQIIIALTAGPRFLLLLFDFIVLFRSKSYLPYITLISGVLRTFMAGGWMYITSTDDHDAHDVFMIAYMVLTIPWTVGMTLLSPRNTFQRKARFYSAVAFFGTIGPLIYWFIQHKVHVRPGAYSIYAYFEWGLIFLDILFDSWSAIDFSKLDIIVSGHGIELIPGQKKKPIEISSTTKTTVIDTEEEDLFTNFEGICNVMNSFIYWSVVTSLFLCVWYFPLWHMGLSGYEAVIISMFLSPLFTIIPYFRNLLAKYPSFTRISTVIFGIGAYKVHDPEQRLLTITIGTSFAVLSLVVEFWALSNNNQPKKLHSYIISIMVGLLTTSIFKYLCYSNNPIWPIMHKENGGYNNLGIFLGLVLATFTPSVFKQEPPKISSSKEKKDVKQQQQPEKQTTIKKISGSMFLAGLGFGGYYFSITSFLTDSGTLATWTWEGYPIRGPTPVTGALFHFGAFIIALIVILKKHPSAFSGLSYNIVVGGGSALLMYQLKGWAGYAGAVVYTFWLVSVGPIIWQSMAGYNPAISFFWGFLVNIVLSLASVWIVAYAFVPGGPLLRERTDIILGTSFGCILLGVVNYNLRNKSTSDTFIKVNYFSCKALKQFCILLTILSALTITIFIKRYPTEPYQPYNEESKSFNAGIWCVHFGLDNDMWSSETRMKTLIEEAELDIVGLLETDTQRLIGGNRDFTQTIAEELGMYADYGPGPNKHTWGAALLSKFPIIESTHHLLPSPVGELAPAIHATLDIFGELVDVVVFHSGQEEDIEDRRLQSLGVQEIMGNSTRPLVLLSYLVTEPLKGNYNTYVSEKSRMYDIDNTDWDRWCEYILFRELKKVAYARISRSTITDTELQVAKFKLLTEEEKNDEDKGFYYGNNFVDENEIPENLRMPQLFRGDGVRGHRYHVFDEPRYFAQEKSQVR